jgi:hypothetical protein
MATNFPGGIDTFVNPNATSSLDSPSHSGLHTDLGDAVTAVETYLNETYNPTYRNLIINGAMQVAQRGTSTTGITSEGYFTADRFRISIGSMGTWTQTVENDAPTGSGFQKSLKMLCTTADAAPAADDTLIMQYRIEGQNLQAIRKGTSSAQQLTLSFWAKSNVTGTYIIELFDGDNSRQVSAAYTINSSATWEKKTIVFPADTTGSFDNDNATSLTINCWLGVGSNRSSGTLNTVWAANTNANRAVGQTNLAAATNNYWQITGVQLEVGAVATPFEFKPIDAELAQCQRYYQKYFQTVLTGNLLNDGRAVTTTIASFAFITPVRFRVNPTVLDTANIGVYRYANTTTYSNGTWSLTGASYPNAEPRITYIHGSGVFTANDAVAFVTTSASVEGYIGLGAEL